jgi:hypothetical protein
VTGRVVSRRAVLGAAVGATVAGCAGPGRPIQVAVVWSGDELTKFREVVGPYHKPVEVVSVRNDMDAFLRARASTASQPDVAIFPQIGLIADYHRRGWLVPMKSGVSDRFDEPWNDPLRIRGVPYGAWVKAAHKSLFWHRPGTLAEQDIPKTWGQLVALVRQLARSRRPAPLAIGAADGWVLTDWFENVLASVTTHNAYKSLITGEARWDWSTAVRTALERLAELWSVPGAFPDGGRRALLTQHEESVLQVFAEPRATMVFEGDFVASVASGFQPTGAPPPSWFRFPPVAGDQRLLVAGDAAVVFKGSTDGPDLVDWLTGEKPFKRWIQDGGGYLSPNLRIPQADFGRGLARDLSEQLRTATYSLRIDLSDQLPGSFGGPDGLGIWKVLQDFFADVAVRGATINAAVGDARHRLQRAAEQAQREAVS